MRKNLFIITYFLIVFSISAQNGISRSYYPDRTLRSEISWVNDILDGPALEYFPNGNLKEERNFSKGVVNGFVREFYETGLLKEEYTVRFGVKEGTHRIFYENGALKEIIIFENGKSIRSTKFNFDPFYTAPPEAYLVGNRQQQILEKRNQQLICDADICPVPIGGMKVIQENLIYPEHALLYGLEGEVILIAVVDEKGDVIETQIVKGLGLGTDEAAQDAVKKTRFIPGQKNGRAAVSRVTLHLKFKIFDRSLVINNSNTPENYKSVVINEQKLKQENIESVDDGRIRLVTEIKCDYEECPYPKEGIKSINRKVEVPGIAKRLKLKGEIIIEAEIDKLGYVRDTRVINGIGYGCDSSVQSAIMNTIFSPAKSNGEEVDSKITIYFPFDYSEY